MSTDPIDEKCFGCDAIMPSFLECCPSCGWERPKPLSREARLRAMGGNVGPIPKYAKVLFAVIPLSVIFLLATASFFFVERQWQRPVTVTFEESTPILLKEPPPMPEPNFLEGIRGKKRRDELHVQWALYKQQQYRLRLKKELEQQLAEQAKLEDGTTTK